jgi:hypothetical protein
MGEAAIVWTLWNYMDVFRPSSPWAPAATTCPAGKEDLQSRVTPASVTLGPMIVQGLTNAEAEDLVRWLESEGMPCYEVSWRPGRGFKVRFGCSPMLDPSPLVGPQPEALPRR